MVRQLTPFIKLVPDFVTFIDTGVREKVMERLVKLERSESQIEDIKNKASVERFLDQALEAFNVGDITGALQSYNQILELDSEHVMTYYNMANIYLELKLMDEAESFYRRTLEINPFYLFGSIGLAKLYVFSGQPEKAVEVLQDTLKWYSGDQEVSLYLGLAYAFQKDGQKAIEELKKSLQWDPTFPPAHYYLGVQYKSWNSELAKKHIKKFLQLASSQPGYENLQPGAKKILNKL